MTGQNFIVRLFAMNDTTWERHANPWSVWTRVPSLVPLLLAIWSHTWLGVWAIVPLATVAIWLWINPRLFPPPASTDNWASQAVLGERVWLNSENLPIPEHHRHAAFILTALSSTGFAVAVIGAILNDLLLTVSGAIATFLAKMWFCDRMVWLYNDMKDQSPVYRSWLRS